MLCRFTYGNNDDPDILAVDTAITELKRYPISPRKQSGAHNPMDGFPRTRPEVPLAQLRGDEDRHSPDLTAFNLHLSFLLLRKALGALLS